MGRDWCDIDGTESTCAFWYFVMGVDVVEALVDIHLMTWAQSAV